MINAALEYLDMGFSVIPVKRSDKRPYISWKEFQTRLPSEDEVESWFEKWPGANIAIITGSISGLWIIDADGPNGIEWVNKNVPKTGVYNHTGKGVHALFKIPPNVKIKNAVRLAPEVDIRGDGGYFVAPPSIHQTGHQYKWQFLLDGWEDLTVYAPQVTEKKTGNLNLDLSESKVQSEVKLGVKKGERDVSIYKEACRLRGKNLSYDEAWAVLKEFASKCEPPFPEKETRIKLDQAWKHEPNIVLESSEDVIQETETELPIPQHLLKPGGFLQDIMNCIDENSAASVPFFNLAGAIALVGNVCGMKVQTETGLRTNFYICCLGYSGTGKNAPFDPMSEALLKSNASMTKGDSEFASGAGLFRQFTIPGREIQLMFLDEMGMVLKGLKSPGSPSGEVPRLLVKLFSSTSPESKTYASGEQYVISWQHLSFFGASTPERFYESLSGGEVTDGFLARMLLFESHHDALLPKMSIKFGNYDQIIAQINRVFNIKVETEKGNLNTKPIPKIVPMAPESYEIFDPWRNQYHHMRNKFKGDPSGLYSIYGRVAEHALKLSLVHAVSMQLENVKFIEPESIQWACDFMDYHTKHIVKQIKENVADTEIQRWKQKVIKGIRSISKKRDYNGATLRDIQRGPCQGLLKNDLERIIESLLLSENIGSREENKKKIYFVGKKLS